MQKTKEGEGENIFNAMIGIAVVFFVMCESHSNDTQQKAQIHYYDIGDYLDRETKLQRLIDFKHVLRLPLLPIVPNQKGDWINQRGEDFDKLLPLKADKGNKRQESIFIINSCGVATNRDAWVYNFSKENLKASMQTCIRTYNENLANFNVRAFRERHSGVKKDLYKQLDDRDITIDESKIAWSRALKNKFIKSEKCTDLNENNIRICAYRPFTKEYLYWDKTWNEMQYQMPRLFPKDSCENILLNTTSKNLGFSALMSKELSDLHLMSGATQAFPLYYYENGCKECAISNSALETFRVELKDKSLSKEDIFYYIYAIFHHKMYLAKYKFELSKESPRVAISADFRALSTLGLELARLHLDYESVEMFDTVEYESLFAEKENDEFYRVVKMKKGKTEKGDNIIIYNPNITIKNIPEKAYEYKINGKSAIDWVIERYQVSIDKKSLIKNDPNDFRGCRYVFELLLRIINLSLKSVDLIEEISKLKFE